MSAPSVRYGSVARSLHWLLALFIVAALVLGWYMTGLPFSPARLRLFNWHKWLGTTILLGSALRLLWRLWRPAPALPASMGKWAASMAHLSHGLMYVLFFAVPLIGWARSNAGGFPIVYLGLLPLPDLVGKDLELVRVLKPAHAVAAYGLLALVLLHLAAVIKHAMIDRDDVLSRMLPGHRR